MVLGFGPTYFYRGTVFAKLPSALIHVHGAVFSSWVVLYVVQTLLVAMRKVRWHRTLGTYGAVLAGLMVVLGWAATLQNVARGRTPSIFTPAEFLVINLWGIVLFAAMVGWAIVKRRDAAAHKRLMLLATIGIMPPAITRIELMMHWPRARGAVVDAGTMRGGDGVRHGDAAEAALGDRGGDGGDLLCAVDGGSSEA